MTAGLEKEREGEIIGRKQPEFQGFEKEEGMRKKATFSKNPDSCIEREDVWVD